MIDPDHDPTRNGQAEVFEISGFSSLSIFSIHSERDAALAALR